MAQSVVSDDPAAAIPDSVYSGAQVDTADLVIPTAQEVIVDVPSAFYAARHQRGEINGLRYVLFPDGSGKVMQLDEGRSVLFRLECSKGVSCSIVDKNGHAEVVPATGASKPVLPANPQGRALAQFLAEWILAGTGEPPLEEPAEVEAVEQVTMPVLAEAETEEEKTIVTGGPEQVEDGQEQAEVGPVVSEDEAPVVSQDLPTTQAQTTQPRTTQAQSAMVECPEGGDCTKGPPKQVQPMPRREVKHQPVKPKKQQIRKAVASAAPPPKKAVKVSPPEERETFFERINLSCSITGSVTLRYKNHSSGSERFGKPRASLGCGARLTEKLSLRVTAIGYGDKHEKSPSDADFTYAITYRATKKITLSYSNYSARFDNGDTAIDSLTSGTFRASYRLPKIKLPNDKTIGCSASLGLPNIKEKTVNLTCSYAVTDRFRISGTAYGYFAGEQEPWDADFAYTASYRINDDWSVTYSNYANNRFFWNESSGPGEGIWGGTVSLTYRFKF
jgi:hypothetical protein